MPIPRRDDSDILQRFLASMQMNYEKWHDGIGYDLDALRALSPGAQAMIEQKVTPPNGWRDVEALAVINTPSAQATLRRALHSNDLETRMAVLSNAHHLIDDESRASSIIEALTRARPYDGLTQTLDQVLEFHPPAVVDALWAGLLRAANDSAYHFAATLAVLYGVIESRDDESMRLLCLQFVTPDANQRRRAFGALCTALGVDAPSQLAKAELYAQSQPDTSS